MGIGVGKVNEFRLRSTVREKKVESGTTEGLTIKSEPEENRGKPDIPLTPPLHPTPRAGNSLWETLVHFISTFS